MQGDRVNPHCATGPQTAEQRSRAPVASSNDLTILKSYIYGLAPDTLANKTPDLTLLRSWSKTSSLSKESRIARQLCVLRMLSSATRG